MKSKKAQGMPMNVIIIAIIVLVVLIIVIAFFAGGFTGIASKIRGTFGGVTGQAEDLAIQSCQSLCESAGNLAQESQQQSAFCKRSFLIDDDGNPDTVPVKMSCSSDVVPELTDEDQRKRITGTGSLAVSCPGVSC